MMLHLRTLILGGSSLTSSIPSSLALCDEIYYFYLSGNMLTGSIPAVVANFLGLQGLILSSNYLSKTIPEELSMLSALQALLLDDNELTGTIPASLGNQSTIYTVYLSQNRLWGSLPSALLRWAEYVDVSFNSLTGALPDVQTPTYRVTNVFTASNNQFTGTIPQSLISRMSGYNTGDKYLNIGSNRLEGNISFVGNMRGLVDFAINGECVAVKSFVLSTSLFVDFSFTIL